MNIRLIKETELDRKTDKILIFALSLFILAIIIFFISALVYYPTIVGSVIAGGFISLVLLSLIYKGYRLWEKN